MRTALRALYECMSQHPDIIMHAPIDREKYNKENVMITTDNYRHVIRIPDDDRSRQKIAEFMGIYVPLFAMVADTVLPYMEKKYRTIGITNTKRAIERAYHSAEKAHKSHDKKIADYIEKQQELLRRKMHHIQACIAQLKTKLAKMDVTTDTSTTVA